jgi:SAM-dependent methyltransferase
MSEKAQREFFEKLARRYDSRFCRSRWPRNQERKAQLVADTLGESIRRGPLVEIGCGTGQVAEVLLRRFPELDYVGLDLSPNMLEIARRRLEPFADRIELAVASEDRIHERDGGYGGAFGIDVLHHVEDPPALLRRLREALRPGARAVFLEANPIFPITAVMGLVQTEERGVLGITPRNLRRWYAEAGFDDVDVALGPVYTPPAPDPAARVLDAIDRRLSRTPLLRHLALYYRATARAPTP